MGKTSGKNATMIREISIEGYKSIRKLSGLELGPLNVLVGANGSGKSNLLSFLGLVREMARGRLQMAVAREGGASFLLHHGPKTTEVIHGSVTFQVGELEGTFGFDLTWTKSNSLDLQRDMLDVHGPAEGHVEHLRGRGRAAESVITESQLVSSLLDSLTVYHFADTSPTSRMRLPCAIEDGIGLRSDGSNLAAFLYRFQKQHPDRFRGFLQSLQRVFPDLEDFELHPHVDAPETISLMWRNRWTQQLFGPQHLSDGTLRAIAIFSLLLQPVEHAPRLLILDEVEIGLHPHALSFLAGHLKSYSVGRQVIVATQSVEFVDCFEVPELIVCQAENGSSNYITVGREEKPWWAETYKLGRAWSSNLIGLRGGR